MVEFLSRVQSTDGLVVYRGPRLRKEWNTGKVKMYLQCNFGKYLIKPVDIERPRMVNRGKLVSDSPRGAFYQKDVFGPV